jgi:thiamine biosynthesis lipoprotein
MSTATVFFPAIGTTAQVVVTEPRHLPTAERVLRDRLTELDDACSRFRADSEISRLHQRAGSAVTVSPLLFDALTAALTAAATTGGLVDPTVGTSMRLLGYDRDFAAIAPDDPAPAGETRRVPGWWRIGFDPGTRQVVLPRGVDLDLGATAKAFAADRIASELADRCGVFVNLGGDLAVAGPPPEGGWRVSVGDDHTGPGDQVVAVHAGGLATSSTTRRMWRRGGRTVHHIVDPRTGDVAAAVWRTVSVAAPSCAEANAAATAAIVLGADAPDWLAKRGLPARLVAVDGTVTVVRGWPAGRRRAS